MKIVARVLAAAQYLGTPESADDVLSAVQTTVTSSSIWSLGSADADSVVIHEIGEYGEADWYLPTGHWMVISSAGPTDFPGDEVFSRQYRTVVGEEG